MEIRPWLARVPKPPIHLDWKNLRGLLNGALDLLLPPSCAACGAGLGSQVKPAPASSRVCRGCWDSIALLEPPFCPRCGVPFASEFALLESPGHECGRCREKSPRFDSARAASIYEGSLREILHTYKFGGTSGLARALGKLLADHFPDRFRSQGFDLVTHVPLHPRRYRERGFDQAWLLARALGRSAGFSTWPYILERTRWEAAQPTLTGPQRWANVRGAFLVRKPEWVEGRSVLLVDDVLTTGATADACAKALKDSGATEVHVYTLARTP
ncbi:MAG: ComF family protein [Nitrospinota bacterium]